MCPPALAIVCSAQVLPFQRSASPVPVAVQALAAVQETASSSLTDEPPRLGVVWIFQVLPFHISASEAKLAPVLELPTASHADPAGQETPLSWLLSAPLAFGVDWMLHALPFHTSARISVTPPLLDEPTASQKVGDVHESPASCPPPGSGMVTIVHVPPARASARRWLSVAPTAIHQVPDGQDTALKLHVVAPEGGGVGFCSQLAAAGWAAVSSTAVTSAPVIATRFIPSSLPRS